MASIDLDTRITVQGRMSDFRKCGIKWHLYQYMFGQRRLFEEVKQGVRENVAWSYGDDLFLVYWNPRWAAFEACRSKKRKRAKQAAEANVTMATTAKEAQVATPPPPPVSQSTSECLDDILSRSNLPPPFPMIV